MENCWLFDTCNHKDCDKPFCLRYYKLDSLFKHSLLADSQRKRQTLVVDADKTDLAEFTQLANIEKSIGDFVSNGSNLFLHSRGCGCGKTSWAVRMIQAYFNEVWPYTRDECRAMFISVPRFLTALKDNISSKSEYVAYIKENIYKADLIVWDDISAKTGTEFEINQLLSLIDGRYALRKANIYTSNRNHAEIQNDLGERLASRVCSTAIDIELHGKDKRPLAANGGLN